MEEEEQPPIRLPSDLYLPILDHVHDNAQLAELCGVDRLFLELAREKLYAFVWVRPCMYLAAQGGLPSDNHRAHVAGEAGADPKVSGSHRAQARRSWYSFESASFVSSFER